MTERSKIVVTGADGFVGRALVEYLRERTTGEVVRCVRPGKAGPNDLAYDLAENGLLPALHDIDVIVHTAARVHFLKVEDDPLPAFRAANVAGTIRLAEAAADAGVRRFVFLSSIAANGNVTPIGQPFTPSDIPSPQNPYGVSKLEAEQALLALSQRSTMEVVIVRPTLVYGPGAGGNVQQMLKWLRLGIPLPLADIHNRRSFVSLYNLVDLLALCTTHPAAGGEIFLAGDAEVVSTSTMLSALARGLGRSPRLFWVPKPLLRMLATALGKRAWVDILYRSLTVDISKNSRLLGWSPPQSFDAGINATTQPANKNLGK
ncbi:NAD-dependent epimerase/dehydratase family protein [Pseudomonas protegens]|uniref:NAD-dependent epimerase/dehydratase family protein n=1 Tax=Pseudomonas protegens TaxID=380021 RepID=UPI00381696A9